MRLENTKILIHFNVCVPDSNTADPSSVRLSAYKDGFSGHRASSDSDILKNCDEEESKSDGRSLVLKRSAQVLLFL